MNLIEKEQEARKKLAKVFAQLLYEKKGRVRCLKSGKYWCHKCIHWTNRGSGQVVCKLLTDICQYRNKRIERIKSWFKCK